MGNTPSKGSGHYSIADYQKKAKREPFKLAVDAETTITIEPPTADGMFEAEQAFTSKDAMRAICGDAAEEILDLFGPLPAEVFEAFSKDLQKHFGLGESDASRT